MNALFRRHLEQLRRCPGASSPDAKPYTTATGRVFVQHDYSLCTCADGVHQTCDSCGGRLRITLLRDMACPLCRKPIQKAAEPQEAPA